MCDIDSIKCVYQHTKNMMKLHPLGFVAFGGAVSLVTAYSLLIVYYVFPVNDKSQTFGSLAYITFLLCVWLTLLLRVILQYMSAGEVVYHINIDEDGARQLLVHIIEAALANNRFDENEIAPIVEAEQEVVLPEVIVEEDEEEEDSDDDEEEIVDEGIESDMEEGDAEEDEAEVMDYENEEEEVDEEEHIIAFAVIQLISYQYIERMATTRERLRVNPGHGNIVTRNRSLLFRVPGWIMEGRDRHEDSPPDADLELEPQQQQQQAQQAQPPHTPPLPDNSPPNMDTIRQGVRSLYNERFTQLMGVITAFFFIIWVAAAIAVYVNPEAPTNLKYIFPVVCLLGWAASIMLSIL
ncbi:hypothetical protein CAEBREN_16625 [Caenorhabditis brenneri]|uniref:Uncharacterized protein n=1 Tax=Caenorhabditis brenneri TaxID=135651 RepID=G0N197_CAEBE|nr:hypothetical protein CAEBREN_16625 [Caenorhabditis brenneri]